MNGGRFAPVGVRAVYASLEEETAFREVTSRKSTLGGRSQINVGEYPRMTYILAVTTRRNLNLAATLPPELGSVVRCCLRGRTHADSQELAAIWVADGIESIVFSSATGAGRTWPSIWVTPWLAALSFATAIKYWQPYDRGGRSDRRRADLHWYEAHGVGRRKMKLKRVLN